MKKTQTKSLLSWSVRRPLAPKEISVQVMYSKYVYYCTYNFCAHVAQESVELKCSIYLSQVSSGL